MNKLIISSIVLSALLSGQTVLAQATSTSSAILKGSIEWPTAEAKFLTDHTQNSITQARLSDIAVRKGTSKKVRNFAAQMLRQSNEESDFLQAISVANGLGTFVALDAPHQLRVQRISKLPKDVFNEAYLSRLNEDQVEELHSLLHTPVLADPRLEAWAENREDVLRTDIVEGAYVGTKNYPNRVVAETAGSDL